MRYSLLETPVDVLSFDETVGRAIDAMEKHDLCVHVALNAAKLVKMRKDPVLQTDVRGADIIGIDGMAIVWALQIMGGPRAERVSGVDLMQALLEQCARLGYRPFILGARQEHLERAATVARQRWPRLEFAGLRNGYFTRDEEDTIVAEIRASGADCLFIAMPTPRKERFLAAHGRSLGVTFIMGVGGSIDVLAGHVDRAPVWMQKFGLEWLFRLIQEPRKMFWRYTSTNIQFVLVLAKAWLRREWVGPAI